MIPLKLYTDVHIDKAVATQLRLRGVDIIRCQDVGMHDASDEEHLQFATSQGRAVVTSDDDFLALDAKWRDEGRTHAGIFFVKPEVTNSGDGGIGITVKTLLFWYEAVEAEAASVGKDVYNQVHYIP